MWQIIVIFIIQTIRQNPRTNINSKYGRLVTTASGNQNAEGTSLYLYNANYLKLKNLTFGYTVPVSVSKKVFIENLRVYISIENVFNITKYPGQDPELRSRLPNIPL